MSSKSVAATSASAATQPPGGPATKDLEGALAALAWAEAPLDPTSALGSLGVEVPAGMKLDVRVQRPDTLYFVIPPLDVDGRAARDEVVNQMDLWSSGDQFVWLLPQDAKVALLAMREQYRSSNGHDR